MLHTLCSLANALHVTTATLSFAGPAPTTGVPVVVTGHDTVEPTVSATCDVFPLYYHKV